MKNKNNLTPAEEFALLDSVNLLGILGLNNVSIVDRPFSVLMNNGNSFLNASAVYGAQGPIKPTVITAAIPTAGQLARLGVIATVNDLVAEVRFDQTLLDGILQNKLGIAGFVITQRFKNNAVSAPYELFTRYYKEYGTGIGDEVIATELNRDPQVEPSAGANSASEFIMLSVVPGLVYSFDSTTKSYNVATEQQQGYAMPIQFSNQSNATNLALGLVQGAALIFKDQAAIPQTLTVTPIICSAVTLHDIKDIVVGGLIH